MGLCRAFCPDPLTRVSWAGPRCLGDCGSVARSEEGGLSSLAPFFSFQGFGPWGSVVLPYAFNFFFFFLFEFCEKCRCCFGRDCIESADCRGRLGRFNSILPVQEHGESFCLFMLSSVSFLSILKLSNSRPVASLERFIPRWSILMQW